MSSHNFEKLKKIILDPIKLDPSGSRPISKFNMHFFLCQRLYSFTLFGSNLSVTFATPCTQTDRQMHADDY